MYEKEKRLPEIIRQVGEIKGNDRVYIEEYAYGYLHELKKQAENGQIRAALYGNTFCRENMRFYLIYGVVRIQEEEEKDRTPVWLQGENFFSTYEKIGYVNLHRIGQETQEPEGCYVFCETNEAMQEYLLKERGRTENSSRMTAGISKPDEQDRRKIARGFIRSKVIQKLFLGIMLLVAAVATAVINHYEGMREFAVMAAKAAQEIR